MHRLTKRTVVQSQGAAIITSVSKLQPLTAAGTHEAELFAMSSAADESVWLRSLLLECGFVIPPISGEVPSNTETPTGFRSYAALIPPSPLHDGNL